MKKQAIFWADSFETELPFLFSTYGLPKGYYLDEEI